MENLIARKNYSDTFKDFTESAYVEILNIAKINYQFASYSNCPMVPHVLWRHDVDYSMHRAYKLAQLEYEAGVQATYFLYPHSVFYNLMTRTIVDLVHKIMDLGHDIGLHFDPTFYSNLSMNEFIENVSLEKYLIETFIKAKPKAISFHLYGVLKDPPPKDDYLCGMANAYGDRIFKEYGYVSDSNGIWRFRRLKEVLEEAKENKLQVLTHPEWWTPEVLSPRARIQRCIDGYAVAMGQDYDAIVEASDRPNVR